MNKLKIIVREILVMKFMLLVLIILLVSCAGVPYKNMNIIDYEFNTVYEFDNDSKHLIIYIDGSGWSSVLGHMENDKWKYPGFPYLLDKKFGNEYSIFVPERLNMRPGTIYYYNPEMRKEYVLENLVKIYSTSINKYLELKSFDSIVLIGISEGAALLPMIYSEINLKNNIKCIVSMAYGGLNVFEQIKILGNSSVPMADYWREACLNAEIYKKDVEQFKDSLGELNLLTYRWWYSFKDYEPLEYFMRIDIPILFVHGELDNYVPVESTRYIQANAKGKPFEYMYISDKDHFILYGKSQNKYLSEIKMWIKNHI